MNSHRNEFNLIFLFGMDYFLKEKPIKPFLYLHKKTMDPSLIQVKRSVSLLLLLFFPEGENNFR